MSMYTIKSKTLYRWSKKKKNSTHEKPEYVTVRHRISSSDDLLSICRFKQRLGERTFIKFFWGVCRFCVIGNFI